jgi:hypothetical protein
MSRVKSIEEQLLESMGHTNVGAAYVKEEAVALPSKLGVKRISESKEKILNGKVRYFDDRKMKGAIRGDDGNTYTIMLSPTDNKHRELSSKIKEGGKIKFIVLDADEGIAKIGDFSFGESVSESDLPQDVIAKIKANNDKMTDLKKNGGSQEEIDALEKENDELNGGNKTFEEGMYTDSEDKQRKALGKQIDAIDAKVAAIKKKYKGKFFGLGKAKKMPDSVKQKIKQLQDAAQKFIDKSNDLHDKASKRKGESKVKKNEDTDRDIEKLKISIEKEEHNAKQLDPRDDYYDEDVEMSKKTIARLKKEIKDLKAKNKDDAEKGAKLKDSPEDADEGTLDALNIKHDALFDKIDDLRKANNDLREINQKNRAKAAEMEDGSSKDSLHKKIADVTEKSKKILASMAKYKEALAAVNVKIEKIEGKNEAAPKKLTAKKAGLIIKDLYRRLGNEVQVNIFDLGKILNPPEELLMSGGSEEDAEKLMVELIAKHRKN